MLYTIDITQKKTYKIRCDSQLIHVEEYGNIEGIPAVFFHGGPGQGFSAKKAGYFDPEKYRIILIDQRGSGQSMPKNSLEENNTLSLLEDADHIRQTLNIEKWVIVGNSWGAALALLYAEKYPEHVYALVLRGTFLAQSEESLSEGSRAAQEQPEAWMAFKSKTQALLVTCHIDDQFFSEHHNDERLVAIYHYLLTQRDFPTRQKATSILNEWLNHILALSPLLDFDEYPSEEDVDATTVEFHYSKNHYFLEKNKIIEDINIIVEHNIPIHLIHGNKDLICSPSNADAIQRCLPEHLVTRHDVIAGHMGESVTDDATIIATDSIASMILMEDSRAFRI